MICASIDVVIQAARLRDGSRRITHITEVMGMEGDVIITQDLFIYDMIGEDANGNIIGRHRSTGIGRPRFWDRARYYGEEKRLAAALDAAEVIANEPAGRTPWIPSARTAFPRRRSPSAAWHGFPLSDAVGPAQRPSNRMASVAQGRAGRAFPGRQAPALPPRTGRKHAEGISTRAAKRKRSVPLSSRLTQAGLSWSKQKFMIVSGGIGVVLFLVGATVRRRLAAGRSAWRFAGGFGLPRWDPEISQEAPRKEIPQGAAGRRRRDRARHQGRPAAVRFHQGRRGRCAGTAQRRIPAPSSRPRRSACRSARPARKLFERMPVPEANFFGIVIAIQQKSGGNLSEALGNLSKVLRDRKKMGEDSGDVDGSQGLRRHHRLAAADRHAAGLPLDPRLHLAAVDPSDRSVDAGGCVIWMSIGIFVMKK
jgi:hypothetical protein